ncbi:MAG: thiamine phosphate synthase [Nitrolancea sp.]
MTNRAIPRLHLISDSRLCDLTRFVEIACLAVDAGVDAIHLREKSMSADELLRIAIELKQCIGGRAALFINDRVDVAQISGADGVQLGERSLPVADVRRLPGDARLIGRSVHDVDGTVIAARDGADFVIAGHVYATASKAGQPPRGSRFIAEIVAGCSLPVIAIGGITPERVPEVLRAGAHGVAVLSGILAAENPGEAARAYAKALRGG